MRGSLSAIACTRCNQKKTNIDVLSDHVNKPTITYPNASVDFVIPHPYYDKYEDHINIKNEWYFEALDGEFGKGANLIHICKLNEEFESRFGILKGMTLNNSVADCHRALRAAETGNHSAFLDAVSLLKRILDNAEGSSLAKSMAARG
jgi:hypothetical protein